MVNYNLGTNGRTTASVLLGSVSFPGNGSVNRVAKFISTYLQSQGSQSLGSTPYAQNSNGGYGGGGGSDADDGGKGTFGGAGAGGNGGSINNNSPSSQSLSVWSILLDSITVLTDLNTFANILELDLVDA